MVPCGAASAPGTGRPARILGPQFSSGLLGNRVTPSRCAFVYRRKFNLKAEF